MIIVKKHFEHFVLERWTNAMKQERGGVREAAHIRIHKSTSNKDGVFFFFFFFLQPHFEPIGNCRPSQRLKYNQVKPTIFGLKKVQFHGGLKALQREQFYCCVRKIICHELKPILQIFRWSSFLLLGWWNIRMSTGSRPVFILQRSYAQSGNIV